jgi:hypothetical protein
VTPETTVLLQTFVGVVLLVAGLAKVITRTSVVAFLQAAGFRTEIAWVASGALPPLELITGTGLLIGLLIVPASGIAMLLSAIFCVVLVAAYRQRIAIGCRCFGTLDSDHLSIFAVGRALLLLLATIPLFASEWINRSSSGTIGNVARFPTAVEVGFLVGMAFVVAFALLEQVAMFENRRPIAIAASRSGPGGLGADSIDAERI